MFKGSRKVAFGLWLFFICNIYFCMKLIAAADWMTCVALCSALIGGGTAVDKYFESKKGGDNASPDDHKSS